MMRLPWGTLDSFVAGSGRKGKVALLGCLSFESRCLEVAKLLRASQLECVTPHFLEIHDPPDAFPDYSAEATERIESNWKSLEDAGVKATRRKCELLATEDELVDLLGEWDTCQSADLVVLDMSSFPKRYFCFFLKQMIRDQRVRRLVVTYTQAGKGGYTPHPLCDDPMPCDFLPGYVAPLPPTAEWLVVSVGYEPLNISSLVLPYRDLTRKVKFLLAFPPSVHTNERQWATLLQVAAETGPENLKSKDVGVVSLWDTEDVYQRLQLWMNERQAELAVRASDGRSELTSISLAPFGPKPHSLGMALFAIKNRCGMYYTQPKSYNPDYSSGAGQSWFYAVKWDGVACFDRQVVRQ